MASAATIFVDVFNRCGLKITTNFYQSYPACRHPAIYLLIYLVFRELCSVPVLQWTSLIGQFVHPTGGDEANRWIWRGGGDRNFSHLLVIYINLSAIVLSV